MAAVDTPIPIATAGPSTYFAFHRGWLDITK